MTRTDDIAFTQWERGDLSDEQALRALCSELGEVESELEPLKREQQELRERISHVLGRLGDKTEIPGFGRLEITAPAVIVSYDRQSLDRLVIHLTQDGYGPIAQQIAACRTESQRAGSLRITRSKEPRS